MSRRWGFIATVVALGLLTTGCSTTWDWEASAPSTEKPATDKPATDAPTPKPTRSVKPEPEPTGTQQQTSAFDLKVGDCLIIPEDEEFTDITVVSCDQPHEAEVSANYNAAGTTFDLKAIEDEAMTRCATEFENYVGISPDNSAEHWYNFFTPLDDSWKSGDRVVNCLVLKLDNDNNVVPMTGSAEGIAK